MPATSARLRRLDSLLLVVWILMIAIVRAGMAGETDPYWQVRDGLELLDGRALVAPDSWSWAPVEGSYYPNSPVWNIVLALAWRSGGFVGFFVLTAVSVALFLAAAVWVSVLVGARRIPLLMAVIGVSILEWPGLGARATMPAQVLVLVSLALGYLWGRRSVTRPLWVGVIGMAVLGLVASYTGNWIHVSWATWSAAVAVAWLVMLLLMPEVTRGRAWAYAVAGAAGLMVATLVGPYRLDVFERSSVVFEVSHGLLTEWTPPWDPDHAARWLLPALLAVAVATVAVVWCCRAALRRSRTPGLPLVAALLVIGAPAALAGFLAIRFTAVAWFTLLPVCALGLTLGMDRLHRVAVARQGSGTRNRAAEWSSDAFWRVILAACAVVLFPLSLFAASLLGRPAVSDATALLPRDCRLFAKGVDSAAVLLLRPDVEVWIDGRADYWGRARIESYQGLLLTPDPLLPVPVGADCVLLEDPGQGGSGSAIGRLLDASPEWVRAGSADGYVVWIPEQA